ncbi:50S ribosomal protein L28 [bacterium (Candidatus Torokbacteria) CG09_land_8_20_14_0_10_42_11]|nr:MAG: 50S ribosomal protein L28 [bacterium (Candidatus Torokbacteria) CG09_land_8_20_14_0_10_42_11]
MNKKHFMSSCQICDRKTRMGASRSHSNIATKRLQKLNLQKTTHKGERVLACAKCIKTLGKVK